MEVRCETLHTFFFPHSPFPMINGALSLQGGAFPYTIGRIEHGFDVRPDLCATDNKINPRKYLGSFYTDSLVHDPLALRLLIDVIGKVGFLFSYIFCIYSYYVHIFHFINVAFEFSNESSHYLIKHL